MQKQVKGFLFIFCSLFSVVALTQELEWQALPKGRPFRLTFADPREIRMGLFFEGNSSIHAAIGNYFSLVAAKLDEQRIIHFGIEGAGFFGMREAGGRFPLETTDGLIGVYLEGKDDKLQWQIRYTHISAHLADGSGDSAIPYSREYLKVRLGWVPFTRLHFYAGAGYLVNTVPPVPPLSLQMGGAYFVPVGSRLLSPFVAADVQWKNESAFNPSFCAQLGLALNDPEEAYRSFRFFYGYQTGADFRGQYYDRVITTHALGIEMQI